MARKRVNISIDPHTYDRLMKLMKAYRFKSPCEVVKAMVHILLDRTESAKDRIYDIPTDDGKYIDGMFDDLEHYQPTPQNTNPPIIHRTKKIDNGKG